MTQPHEDFLARFLSGREALYNFLGRMFEREVDKQLLMDLLSRRRLLLRYLELSDPSTTLIKEGFLELHEYLGSIDSDKIDNIILELAADYANLFLGVGYAFNKKGVMHPSESAYIKGYLYSDPVDEVSREYLKMGLIKSPDFHEPEDHIALELYFMAHLCRKAMALLGGGKKEDVLRHLETQREFLLKHLLKWAPRLAEDVIQYANTTFYKAIGKILKGFLNVEEKMINEIIERVKAEI